MTEIDWTTELRKVEREFAGLPPEPTAAEVREWRLEEERERRRRDEVNGAAGAWTRLMLVIALAGGLYFWPYARGCGVGLYAYLSAESAVVIGGMWVGIYSWRRRTPRAHATAFAMVVWGGAMLAMEVLPRVGYTPPDPAKPASWACAE
jgi:hypothetical protein